MKDMPLFATEYGIASLTLSNIPYTKAAYIQIQDSREPEQLVTECRDFCVAVGAESVYATGHTCLEIYPHHTAVLELERSKYDLPFTSAVLSEVSENNMERWREIYWNRMRNVYNAAYISKTDMQKYLIQGKCYFVVLEGKEIGIGMVKDNEIIVVASMLPGMGQDVVLALSKQISGEKIKVTVADQNKPAMRLYEQLGFQCANVVANWYKIN